MADIGAVALGRGAVVGDVVALGAPDVVAYVVAAGGDVVTGGGARGASVRRVCRSPRRQNSVCEMSATKKLITTTNYYFRFYKLDFKCIASGI